MRMRSSALVRMQTRGGGGRRAPCRPTTAPLLSREMELMPEWFFGRHLGIEADAAERAMLDRLFDAARAIARSRSRRRSCIAIIIRAIC